MEKQTLQELIEDNCSRKLGIEIIGNEKSIEIFDKIKADIENIRRNIFYSERMIDRNYEIELSKLRSKIAKEINNFFEKQFKEPTEQERNFIRSIY